MSHILSKGEVYLFKISWDLRVTGLKEWLFTENWVKGSKQSL